MSDFNSKQLFLVLRQILKSKKVSYKKLCAETSFSESTLKNMFHQNNMSIDRLIEICNVIDVSVPDLINLASKEDANDFSFTLDQEKFFASKPHFYYFFRECFFEKKSLEKVKKEYKLTDKTIMKYILGLEKLGLLEVHENNRLKFLVYGKLKWITGGPWVKKFYPVFVKKIVELQDTNLNNPDYFTAFPGFFSVSKKTYENFKREISEVETKYREIAFRDSLMASQEEFVPVTWSFSMVPKDIFALETKVINLK